MLEHGMMRTVASGGGSGGTLYDPKVDIFNDGSGVAFYRFDGNANDESGNYHGAETAVTYGGGQYERGAVFNGSTSRITTTINFWSLPLGRTISFWMKAIPFSYASPISSVASGSGYFQEYPLGSVDMSLYTTVNGSLGTFTNVFNNEYNHIVVVQTTTNTYGYKNGTLVFTAGADGVNSTTMSIGAYNTGSQWYNGSIDQVRIFNRAITAAEVAILYAEAEPTSIVDNINPFEDGSCKALYKFDGDATDATGTYNGTRSSGTYGAGMFGNAAVFNSAGTGVLVPVSLLSTYMSGTNKWSASLWFKVTTIAPAYQQILHFANGSSFAIDIASSTLRMNIASQYTNVTIAANTTYMITVTFEPNILKCYINGSQVGNTIALASVTATSALNPYIGIYGDNVNYPLQGWIDQFRIFNKALTPMEVAALYNETTPLEEPLSYQVDPFKDGSGKALYRLDGNALDESGNYNGTAAGVTYGAAATGREAIFNGSASITATLALTANIFSYSVWVTVTTVGATIQSIIDFSTGRAMLSSGNGTNAYVSYYDGTAFRVFGTYTLTSATRTHIGIAVNGTSVELFINGVSQGTSACNAVTPSGTVALGKYAGSAAGYLTGREDQTRVFNRLVTASEFLQLYTEGA